MNGTVYTNFHIQIIYKYKFPKAPMSAIYNELDEIWQTKFVQIDYDRQLQKCLAKQIFITLWIKINEPK